MITDVYMWAWIDVEEELPDHQKVVAAVCTNGERVFAYYDTWEEVWIDISNGDYLNNPTFGIVAFWMDLPPNPINNKNETKIHERTDTYGRVLLNHPVQIDKE